MNKEDLRSLIGKHVESGGVEDSTVLDEIYKALEPLAEEQGLHGRFSIAVIEHLEEKNKEVQSFRMARNIFLGVAVALIFVVLIIFYGMIATPTGAPYFVGLHDAKIAFVSATFVAAFGLLAIILRGLFHSPDKDDAGGPMVDGVKTLLQLGREVVK